MRAYRGPAKLMYNKFENNYHLANKKALFMNMCNYYNKLGLDPFEVAIPLTFHIKSLQDSQYEAFISHYKRLQAEGQ